jgi:hypothetical protein
LVVWEGWLRKFNHDEIDISTMRKKDFTARELSRGSRLLSSHFKAHLRTPLKETSWAYFVSKQSCTEMKIYADGLGAAVEV